MSVLCGWASQSEKGTANGVKGDQTGKEVRTGSYYSFGQNKVIRFKDTDKAKIAAKAMKAICENNNIGYGQTDRTSSYEEAKKIGWDVNKIGQMGKCNIDCSEACALCINFAYGKALVSSSVYTGNIAAACIATGNFTVVTNFSEDTLQVGDMPLKEKHHIIMALGNGSKAISSGNVSYFSKCNYTGSSLVDALASIGAVTTKTYRTKIATINGITGYTGKATQNTKLLKLLKIGKLIKP